MRLNDTIKVAKAALDQNITDMNMVRDAGVVFGSVKTRTSDREFREIRKRLELLTPIQVDVLVHGDLLSQKQIGFLAVCKHYQFIRDFTVDVIRYKALVYDYQLNESDFVSFINNKILSHPELEEFSDSTLKKAKQVLYHILQQSGIINNPKEKLIQPQLVDPSVIRAVADDDKMWLQIYLLSDLDIRNIKY